jgi:hypothetical protein
MCPLPLPNGSGLLHDGFTGAKAPTAPQPMNATTCTFAIRLPDTEAGPRDTAGWYFISEKGEAYLPMDASTAELKALHADFESDALPYTVELCID